MLDIFLAGPYHFDGTVDVLRDLDCATDTIGLQSPAEAAADQMIVEHDLVQRQAGGLRCRYLGTRDGLVADPDFAAILADMDGAVHRFQSRVREERNLIDRFDLGDGAHQRLIDVSDVLRHRP